MQYRVWLGGWGAAIWECSEILCSEVCQGVLRPFRPFEALQRLPPHLWPHAVLHAIEVNAEQIIFVSIDFNGETYFDMRVLWITSVLLGRIILVIRGSAVRES